MKDEIYQRELGWMELVSRAFFELFQNLKGILLVMAVVFLPISLVDSMITTRLNAISSFLSTVQVAGTFLENKEGIMQALYHMGIGTILALAAELFLVPVGTIAIAKLVKQRIDGAEPNAKVALTEALALEPTIIVAGFIYGVLTTLGMLVLIPGIWLSAFWSLYVYCIGLGGRKAWDSLRHSGRLVEGRWWRTFGYMVALSCIASLWDLVFQIIPIFAGRSFLATAIYDFVTYFSSFFINIGMALLFLNRESQRLGWQDLGAEKETIDILC